MIEMLAFMGANACLTSWLAGLVVVLVASTVHTAALLANRVLRTAKVLVRGWPPEYLDADGDHVKFIESQTAEETP